MKLIILEPLTKTPLSTQLRKLTGEGYTTRFERTNDGVIDTETGEIYLFAPPEAEQAEKDKQKAETEAEEKRLFHLYDNHKNPILDYYNENRWKESLKLLAVGETVEMTAYSFDFFINCMPPVIFQYSAYVAGEAWDTNDKGENIYLCAITKDKKHFAKYGTVKEFLSRKLF